MNIYNKTYIWEWFQSLTKYDWQPEEISKISAVLRKKRRQNAFFGPVWKNFQFRAKAFDR